MREYNPNEVHITPMFCGVCRKPLNKGENICLESLHLYQENLDVFVFFHADCAQELYLKVPVKKQDKEVS